MGLEYGTEVQSTGQDGRGGQVSKERLPAQESMRTVSFLPQTYSFEVLQHMSCRQTVLDRNSKNQIPDKLSQVIQQAPQIQLISIY